ncbi:glycosyl hydrolase family 28-related protein [Glycomyces mayteni]|uniref:Glycosyl hydrolase family 28-related protein n=1 Tax=Glycomyces mayteni TaxID=543887 RepID=A0ABW2D960_9ACTN|nr:hypothetical protein GCM10025732_31570 [Glycomyces mayteni]
MTESKRIPTRTISRRTLFGGTAGVAALAALGATATPAAAQANAGAAMPFKTLGAETGALGGGASVTRFTVGTAVPTAASLELEASGYAYVRLAATGQSVTLRNTTGVRANALVVRAALPDAPGGGGVTATLALYVDGVFRQHVTLSSAQTYLYRGSTANPKDPTGGQAHRFYNDFPFFVTGAAIAPGSTVMLRKDAANTAAWYAIDCVDFENVGPARTRPANSVSVLDYGADPNFGADSTAAIQNAVDAARGTGRPVWIPEGKYLTHATTGTQLDFTGVTVTGAGMWRTILYRRVPLPSNSTYRSRYIVGSGTSISHLQIDSNALYRGNNRAGGADYSLEAWGAGGWAIDSVWTRHCDANWLSGSNGTVRNCRSSDSYGDGFNVNNSNAPNPDKLGRDILVQNNYQRGAGDDGFAVYSDAGTAGASAQIERVRVLNNTSVAPYWANGLRIAGGRDIEFRNNLVDSVSSNSAIDIGVYGDTGFPLESATVTGNVFIGGGGWNSTRHGVRITSPNANSLFPNAYTRVTFSNNTVRGSLRAGIFVDLTRNDVTASGNTVDGPANQGVYIRTSVTGTGDFNDNTVRNLRAGQAAFQNDSPTTFPVTGSGNSWQ